MPQLAQRPPVVITPRPEPGLHETHRFVRWLGWLLVAAVVLGGAGLIWYGIANDAAPIAAETAATVSEIDPYLNPEVKARVNMAPAVFEMIDPHESPELYGSRAAPVETPETRIP